MTASPAHNVASLLARTAHAWPRLPAVACREHVVCDYATLAARAQRQAASLIAAGLVSGDRVAIVSRNVPAYIETLFGCWWAGLVAVPVNSKLHPKELAYVLAN
jgi:long-chain acyl-CoA synthetase